MERRIKLHMGELLGGFLREPSPRRKRLPRRVIQHSIGYGVIDYLEEAASGHPDTAEKAKQLLREVSKQSVAEIGDRALRQIEELHLLKDKTLATVREHAPWDVGKAYAVYLMFGDTAWVAEILLEAYRSIRS